MFCLFLLSCHTAYIMSDMLKFEQRCIFVCVVVAVVVAVVVVVVVVVVRMRVSTLG